MDYINAQFIKGIKGTDPILFDGKPQIAFVGRSNVGKSSTINSLLNRKNLVKSSSTPGKTQEINFFLIDDRMYFVDLPGYGYAKMSEKLSDKLRKMIIWYLAEAGVEHKAVVLIVDAKTGMSRLDLEMAELLKENNKHVVVIANKADKLTQSERVKNMRDIESNIEGAPVFLYSAKTHKGRDAIVEYMRNL